MNRRSFLTTAGAAAAGLALWALRPAALGRGGHDAYFRRLGETLGAGGFARPVMVVDLDRVDHNVDVVMRALGPRALRVVAKSLPSPKLIEYVLQRAGTERVMVFHQPFVNAMAALRPDAELLLGKPMPVAAADRFYRQLGSRRFDAERRLQWLVDTPARLRQYSELASGRGLRMQVNLEIDVGLHRGGVATPEALAGLVDAIEADPRIELAGLMGYEPHVVKVPDLAGGQEREFARVRARYARFLEVVGERIGGERARRLTLNAAGSPTYSLWSGVDGLANELSVGSGLVKPLDFDLPTLAEHVPGAFIATPVLKTSEGLQVPGLGALNSVWSGWDPNRAKTFFTYGGYWKASPVSPPGLMGNSVFGHSSNQEMLNGSEDVELEVDDYVFLRPSQSEFVMLQFGDLVIVRGGEVVDQWPVLDQSGEA